LGDPFLFNIISDFCLILWGTYHIQASLGISFNIENSLSNMFQSLTLGPELVELLGQSDEVNATIDVLEGTLPFDHLPQQIQSNVLEIRDFIYRNGIAVAVLMIWVINILWLYRDKDFEPASALTETLLALLIVLREMGSKK
jgi:hypothetical protein